MKNATAMLDVEPAVKKTIFDLDALEPGVPIHLTNVSWEEYEAYLDIIGDRCVRATYDDGELEILMPLLVHGTWLGILGRLVQELAMELDMDIRSLDPVTLRRKDLKKGIESDRLFYFDNEPLMRSRLTFDLTVDPPPDLVIEAEVTSKVGKRMRIYAALGVPEVWRYDNGGLKVSQLTDEGKYIVVERSRFFPQMPLSELVRFVHLFDQMSERELIKAFRIWVREQIAAGWAGAKA